MSVTTGSAVSVIERLSYAIIMLNRNVIEAGKSYHFFNI